MESPEAQAQTSLPKRSMIGLVTLGRSNVVSKKVNKQILKEAEEMGIEKPVLLPHWHPNQLRHTAATEIRRQFGLEAAQVIFGHAKADVTQIYAERDTEKASRSC